jgi:hypothetical protein
VRQPSTHFADLWLAYPHINTSHIGCACIISILLAYDLTQNVRRLSGVSKQSIKGATHPKVLFRTSTDGQRQQRLRLQWHPCQLYSSAATALDGQPNHFSAKHASRPCLVSVPVAGRQTATVLLVSRFFFNCISHHGPVSRNVRHWRRTVVGWQVQLALTLANSGEAHCDGIGGAHTVPLLANVLEEVHTPELAPGGCEEGAQAASLRMGAWEKSSCRACTPAREAVLISMPSSGPSALECGRGLWVGARYMRCTCRDGAKIWDCRPSDYPYGAQHFMAWHDLVHGPPLESVTASCTVSRTT